MIKVRAPSNLYKFFWKDIGHFVLRSLNYGFLTNELSVTQKQWIITCIPKGDKDKKILEKLEAYHIIKHV